MNIDAINVSDNTPALAVLRQAEENVRGHSILRSVVLDRGFADGKLLSAIERENMLIYISACARMSVTREARGIAKSALLATAEGHALV